MSRPRRHYVDLLAGVVLAFGIALAASSWIGAMSCAHPPDPQTVKALEKEGIVILEKGTCLFLEAVEPSGGVRRACAAADELAPLVPLILDELGVEEMDAGAQGATLAFSVGRAKRKPRRHCVAYADAGAHPPQVASPASTRAVGAAAADAH